MAARPRRAAAAAGSWLRLTSAPSAGSVGGAGGPVARRSRAGSRTSARASRVWAPFVVEDRPRAASAAPEASCGRGEGRGEGSVD